MKKLFLFSVFILTLETSLSQGLFYVAADSYMKLSLNSTHPFKWDSKTAQVSDLFSYNHNSYNLHDPLRCGFSLGINLKPRHSLELSIHFDGVSSRTQFRFASYQTYVNYYTPSLVQTKSRSQQTRFSINYKYKLINKPAKTNLIIFPSVGMVWRAGPKGVGNVGAFGSGGILLKDSLEYYRESISYTAYSKYAIQFGLGIQSDIFIHGKYWFSAHVQYAHSKSYLSYVTDVFLIENSNSGQITKYVFNLYNRASGLYFGISRKFQIIPWKSKSERKDQSGNVRINRLQS